MTLPPMQAGSPWKILLSDGTDSLAIEDVLFGDVFLLGGQSNMELPIERTMERYRKEIESTQEEEIRMFEVPKEYIFGEKRAEIEKGRWIKAKGEDLQLFSAVGYFAAKELHERENVPIGLLQAAVGGTPVKAWCSEETVCRLGYACRLARAVESGKAAIYLCTACRLCRWRGAYHRNRLGKASRSTKTATGRSGKYEDGAGLPVVPFEVKK